MLRRRWPEPCFKYRPRKKYKFTHAFSLDSGWGPGFAPARQGWRDRRPDLIRIHGRTSHHDALDTEPPARFSAQDRRPAASWRGDQAADYLGNRGRAGHRHHLAA